MRLAKFKQNNIYLANAAFNFIGFNSIGLAD
jgi:hypothetical protein